MSPDPEKVTDSTGQEGEFSTPALRDGKPDTDSRPPETVELKIDGEVKEFTWEKALEMAQKGVAADKRFQEAAELRKEAERAVVMEKDLKAMIGGDPDAFRRLGKALELDPDEVEETASRMAAGGVNLPKPQESSRGKGKEEDTITLTREDLARIVQEQEALKKRQVSYRDLSPEIQEVLLAQETERTMKIIEDGVDRDKTLAYYLKNADDSGKKAIMSLVKDKVRGRLKASGKVLSPGAPELAEPIKEVGEILKAVPGTSGRTTPPIGIGPSPGGSDTELHPKKEPDYVPSTDPDFEENILQQLAFNMQKLESQS